MTDWVVGIDLGGTKIEIGLVSPQNRIVGRCRIPTNAHEGPHSVVEADAMLRAAQAQPEQFRSLVVRVAGYSAYFVELDKDLQDEIIRRTEFGQV